MPLALLLTLTLALPAAPRAPGPEDLRGALAGLASETAAERLEAQRWLAARLETEDLPLVADAVLGAGLEVRTRLVAALGADDRHLALAALLATDHDPALRLVGKSALRKMVLRWHGDDARMPLSEVLVASGLEGRFGGTTYSLEAAGMRIDDAVDMLARHLGTPLGLSQGSIGIALNPVLFAQSEAGRDPGGPHNPLAPGAQALVGDPDAVLLALLHRRGLTVEAYAFDGPRAWLHVVDPSGAGSRSADDLLTRWVREVLESPNRTRGAGAARALAGSGWPAALAWLEERWFEHADQNALSGLLLAAGRGRVAPRLARSEMVTRLLGEGDRALAAGDPAGRRRVAELTRALATLGPVGSDGTDLSAVVARGWAEASPAGRDFRLAVLAGMGRAPEELLVQARAWLGATAPAPSTAHAYGILRMLAAVDFARARRPEPLAVPQVLELYELARARGSLGAFDGWLRRAGAVPPAAWADPERLPAQLGADLRARILLWFLDVGGTSEAARRHLVALVAPGVAAATAEIAAAHEAAAGEVLHERALAGGSADLRQLFAAAREQLDAPGRSCLDRLALLAGVLDDERHGPLAEELFSTGSLGPGDLLLVGALSAGPAGDVVRPVLYAAVQADTARPRGLGLEAPWVAAVERAIDDLRRGGRARSEKELQRDLRQLLRNSRHPLVQGLQDDSWPPAPGVRVVPLESLDWRFGP